MEYYNDICFDLTWIYVSMWNIIMIFILTRHVYVYIYVQHYYDIYFDLTCIYVSLYIYSSWSKVVTSGDVPRARYRGTCVVYGCTMILHGGHDGNR